MQGIGYKGRVRLALTTVAVACLCGASAAASATRDAATLAGVPKTLKTPEGQRLYGEQMNGPAPGEDPLGLKLPADLQASVLAGLLVPRADRAALNGIGAKPWPQMPGQFVALACTGGDPASGPGATPCSRSDASAPPLRVYLGVVALNGSGQRLVAGPVEVASAVDWQHSALPSQPEALDDAKDGRIAPASFTRFDLAPYRIAPDVPAFGLRGAWSDSYAGGFGEHEALYLFASAAGQLKQVFAAPVTSLLVTAGDWNKNGTRQHEIQEGADTLGLSDTETDGHKDLVLRSRLTAWQRAYRWSSATGSYRPAE